MNFCFCFVFFVFLDFHGFVGLILSLIYDDVHIYMLTPSNQLKCLLTNSDAAPQLKDTNKAFPPFSGI